MTTMRNQPKTTVIFIRVSFAGKKRTDRRAGGWDRRRRRPRWPGAPRAGKCTSESIFSPVLYNWPVAIDMPGGLLVPILQASHWRSVRPPRPSNLGHRSHAQTQL